MSFKSDEINELVQTEIRLPATHRQGYGSARDDVAQGENGKPVYVPTPETPDDRFS